MTSCGLNNDFLDFVESYLVVGPVVELGGARAGMRGHLLGFLQRALALQVAGDSRRPETMAPGLGAYVCLLDPPPDPRADRCVGRCDRCAQPTDHEQPRPSGSCSCGEKLFSDRS